MFVQELEQKTPAEHRYHVAFAHTAEEILEAQRLRYNVFAGELGARLNSECGVDADVFDPFCKHLIVRDGSTGEVVGTYRILSPEAAAEVGWSYAEQEFDLSRLAHLRRSIVEVGRSCIHPAYRNGAVIALLWSGLAHYMRYNRYDYLVGCASMGMADGGIAAWATYQKVSRTSLAPVEYRAFPHTPLPFRDVAACADTRVPPLLKGYLRLGAYVCGEPAWDPDFNTADLLVFLPLARIDQRYARHFFGKPVAF
jgi:putative hemolysin